MPLANRPCQSALRTWVVKAKKLESNLFRIFKLATRWKAILLLQVTVTVTGPQFTVCCCRILCAGMEPTSFSRLDPIANESSQQIRML